MENGFEYKELPDGTVRITGGPADAEELTFPEKIGDRKVSEIGPMAFSGRKELRRITLPKGLRVIRTNAFSGCDNLDKVFLPDGLEEIEDFAFNNCVMSYIRIPPSVKKTGLHALPDAMLVLPSYSPLAASCRQGRYVYWDGTEPLEKLEERIASLEKNRRKKNRMALIPAALFFVFGFTMMAGLFLRNTQVLTIGWIGTAAFGIIMAVIIRRDKR